MFLAGALTFFAVSKSFAETIFVYDTNGNGSETVVLVGSNSFDTDGALIDFQWKVNGTLFSTGFGPTVANFTHDYALGFSTVTLIVRDDVQVSSIATIGVDVLPQGSNLPPVADANVPSTAYEWTVGFASVSVDASLSHDPDGDLITRYRWTEGAITYYDGSNAITTLSLSGLGNHTLTLTVYSTDHLNITQSGSKNFSVNVQSFDGGLLAGRHFDRGSFVHQFTFDPPNSSFAAISFNPLTQTYFMTDNVTDKLFELQQDGSLIRTIDITGLKRTGIATTDAEGFTWMHGTTYAVALHDGKEIAIVDIVSTTTALNRVDATIYDVSSWSGKPKGLTYAGWENAFYGVTKNAPMTVVKSQINSITGNLDTVWSKTVDNLTVMSDLADVAAFPRLSSSGLFLLSESSQVVVEADLTGATAVMKSSFSTTGWPIPQAGGILFNQNGNMVIVGKHSPGSQDDFNVFTATSAIPNSRPYARVKGM
jgi:uncharacterized protein YjiK